MSSSTLRIIIFIVLLAHGVGHTMGIFPALGLFTTESWHSRSWLLTRLLGESLSKALSIVLWAVLTIGFIVSALAMMGWGVPHEYWRPLATVSAIVSLLTLALYWNAFAAFFNKVGAIGVNLAVLIGLLWVNWPSEAEIGF